MTIIQIILSEICQSKNNNKYDKKLLAQHTIINKINAQSKTIILAHYEKHKLNDTLEIFKDQFCINEALTKIEIKIEKHSTLTHTSLTSTTTQKIEIQNFFTSK